MLDDDRTKMMIHVTSRECDHDRLIAFSFSFPHHHGRSKAAMLATNKTLESPLASGVRSEYSNLP